MIKIDLKYNKRWDDYDFYRNGIFTGGGLCGARLRKWWHVDKVDITVEVLKAPAEGTRHVYLYGRNACIIGDNGSYEELYARLCAALRSAGVNALETYHVRILQ